MSQRCRVTTDHGVGNTSARCTLAGHRIMYSGPVSSDWRTNGPPPTTSLTVVPMNHGTLLPAAPHAPRTSAVAAGSSGRRAKTNAASAATETENTTTLQPSTSVAPTAGTAQVTSTDIGTSSRTIAYGIGSA